jgi:putative endonuclease
MKQPAVYILASQARGTVYIGVTSDLIARMYKHRAGLTGGFVGRYGVFVLVRFELFGDMDQAIAREKQLKNWRREWKVNLVESDNPDWHDLGPSIGLPPIAEVRAR